MTNEEAIEIIKCGDISNRWGDRGEVTENMAITALEQQPILDKIRAEIEQAYCKVTNDYDQGRNYGLYIATQIIDKYTAESEGV